MEIVRKNKRLLTGGLISLLFALQVLAFPLAAHAQLAIGADAPRTAEYAVGEVRSGVRNGLVGTIFTGLVNLLTFAANRFAYDAAVMLASGGSAEEPLIEYRAPEDFWRDYAAAVAGEAVGLLAEELQEAGGLLSNFNLCAPSNPEVLLSIRAGIRSTFQRPEPRCDIVEITENWEGYIAQVTADFNGGEGVFRNEMILTQLSDIFNPQTNELAVGIQLYTDILGKSEVEASIYKDKLLEQGPIKDVTDFVTGNVKTPASMIQHDVQNDMWWSKNVGNQIVLTTLENTDALLQIGLSAASVFTNTLLSSMTNRLYSGLFDFDEVTQDPFDDGFRGGSTRDAAQRRFRSILSVAPLEVTNYNILSEFASCSSSSRGLYNCVADTSFISAVARAETGVPLTLQEAMEEELVDGGWPLISSEDQARDQDPYCYTYGFCHANLVKMRKARIIPVGWELAADSTANSVDDPVTLNEVVEGFDDCNDQGERDDNHPWCKLIDPNWVLKYPDTQCRAMVYGQLLETSAADKRKQECVDMPSCISEGDDGTCTGGYGYCVVEENVWRFRGDACPEYAASCLAFESSSGDTESYLLNTVDYGDCSEGNAGCLWYATEKELQSDDTFAWPTIDDVPGTDAASGTYADRIYLTGAVEECDEEDGGCAELVSREDGAIVNAIPNPSFEDDSNADEFPDVWLSTYATSDTAYDTENAYARTGSAALYPGTGIVYLEGIALTHPAFYTLSYYARQNVDGAAEDAQMVVAISDQDGNELDLRGTTTTGDCALSASGNNMMEVNGTPESETYERFSCTFTVPSTGDAADTLYAFIDIMPGGVWIDDVQLEQNDEESDYHEGYSSDVDAEYVYAKVPPAYLGCTGQDTDPEECENYAGVCAETDVGCSEYTPANGDPAVFAVASELDACPSTCVGYDTFKQEATLYEPEGDFPVYFIPDSAETCEEEDVGCDEFTNLSNESLEYFTYLRACVTPTQALENTDTGDAAATYYTWEGSDLAGYQLVEWTLLESDMDTFSEYDYAYAAEDGSIVTDNAPGSAPCTNWVTGADGITCDDADGSGVLYADTADCNEHDDIFTNPDCREFYDANGVIHYRDWSLTVTVHAACTSYRKTDLVGVGVDSDEDGSDDADENCTNSGGYFDETTATCRYYGYATESESCDESANGCREYTGGRSRNSRVVIEETFEGGDLSDWDAASATDVTYSNESIATDGHSLASSGETVWSFIASEECTTEAGCAVTDETFGGSCTVQDGETYCGTLEDEFYTGKTYTVSFWAKGTGDLSVGFDITADPDSGIVADVSFATVSLSASAWEEYSLGPLNMNEEDYANFGAGTVLVFDPASGVEFYIDNIVIREGEDNITLIKDSWVTPNECDETPDGVASAQYYLGCQEYTDQDSETAYLKSFSSLCSEEKIGCDAYYATHESESPYAEVYNATCSRLDATSVSSAVDCYYEASGTSYETDSTFLCTIGVGVTSCDFDLDWYVPEVELPSHVTYGPSTHVVPADSPMYLIVTDDVECLEDVAGCMEVGLPTFSADRTQVTESTSMWLLNRPEDYADILCDHDELFCDEWTTDESTYYFKSPGDQMCEYRTDVTVAGTTYDGWFRTGTNNFCYGSGTCADSGASCATDADCGAGDSCEITDPSYLIGGDQSGIWYNGDDAYANWVGGCDEQYDSCTEFQDLLDINEGEFYGTSDGASYYYLDNQSLEDSTLPSSQSCDGRVSQKAGCGLFYDITDTSLTSNAGATYIASTHADDLFGDAPYALVDPIDCSAASASTITLPNSAEMVDLCARRCGYGNDQLYGSSGEGYTFGGSCYTNSDCPSYTGVDGDEVTGSCIGDYDDDSDPTTANVTAPRLENDSNRVLKVNRDRECSEWLTCSDTQTVWDERTNSYKTVCSDISLCDEYSADGNASFCSSPVRDSLARVLDIEAYSARDVSWYGSEYSGYAIPDAFPVELLTQVNTSPPPGFCNTAENSDVFDDAQHGAACEEDSDCGGEVGSCVLTNDEVYSLVFNAGSCDEDYGESCTVGYCENTGEACSTQTECGEAGGECLVGTCRVLDTGTGAACTSDADCVDNGSHTTCYAGTCGHETINIPLDDPTTTTNEYTLNAGSCSSFYNGSVVTSTLTKSGACIREQCLLSPSGDAFVPDTGETAVCRGYPEQNSPFPNELVEEWQNPNPADTLVDFTEDIDAFADSHPYLQPYDVVGGFENVKLCAAGEDCTCSYKKVTYGAMETVYLATDSEYPNGGLGICVGGGYDGMWCNPTGAGVDLNGDDELDTIISDDDCKDGSSGVSGGGQCQYAEKEDTLMGLEGYCLERDTSINYHGNRDDDHRACLTWLPVDQLVGSTDLYAKYTGAGYDLGETAYCANVSHFTDLYPYQDGAEKCGSFEYGADCPIGYFAVFGPVDEAGACGESNPYICLPDASRHDEGEGATCDPAEGAFSYTSEEVYTEELTYDYLDDEGNSAEGTYTQRNYYIGGSSEFTSYVASAEDCYTLGLAYQEQIGTCDIQPRAWPLYADLTSPDAYSSCDIDGDYSVYLACDETVQVDDGDFVHAAPYTDRILNTYVGYAVEVYGGTAGAYADFAYTATTGMVPFGSAENVTAVNSKGGVYPPVIAQCTDGSSIFPPSFSTGDVCTDGGSAGPHVDLANPQARAFFSFDGMDGQSLLYGYTDTSITLLDGVAVDVDTHGLTATTASVTSLISGLFARGLNLGVFSDGLFNSDSYAFESDYSDGSMSYVYSTTEEALAISDSWEWDDRTADPNPPKIWALDLSNCTDENCEEGTEAALTLNSANEGNQNASEFFRAYLKFYAAANKNHLPIRRVIVDWQDNEDPTSEEDLTGSSADDNFFKNHRGLQEGSDESICDTDPNNSEGYEWGMNADSCDPNYFSYSHIYTCTEADLTLLPACTYGSDGNITNSPCADGASCYFRPRVHIRDNWGWCTGVCSIDWGFDEDGTEGCFEGNGAPFDATEGDSECAYLEYPYQNSLVDPWVYYDGAIVVTP